jgi:hypothetical protein
MPLVSVLFIEAKADFSHANTTWNLALLVWRYRFEQEHKHLLSTTVGGGLADA